MGIRELPVAPGAQWSLAVVSDVQNGFNYLPDVFRRIGDFRVDGILLLGDLSADHDLEHARLPVRMMCESPAPAPVFIVPGNHDIRGSQGAAEFIRFFGSRTFDVRVGNTQVLGLDNSGDGLPEDALDALDRRLEEVRAQGLRAVLCLHKDVIDWEGGRTGLEKSYARFLSIVRAREVSMVLMGHYHKAHTETRGPTRFVIAPPSGDRSMDTGQTPVSFLVLRWTGQDYSLEQHRWPRTNAQDLRGAYLHLSLAHFRPWVDRHPGLFALSLVLSILVGPWAWIAWARRRWRAA